MPEEQQPSVGDKLQQAGQIATGAADEIEAIREGDPVARQKIGKNAAWYTRAGGFVLSTTGAIANLFRRR